MQHHRREYLRFQHGLVALQARARGLISRKECNSILEQMRAQEIDKRNRGAIVIQSWIRMKLGRKCFVSWDQAARTLQRVVRGHFVRKSTSKRKKAEMMTKWLQIKARPLVVLAQKFHAAVSLKAWACATKFVVQARRVKREREQILMMIEDEDSAFWQSREYFGLDQEEQIYEYQHNQETPREENPPLSLETTDNFMSTNEAQFIWQEYQMWSATKIQSAFRGWITREHLKRELQLQAHQGCENGSPGKGGKSAVDMLKKISKESMDSEESIIDNLLQEGYDAERESEDQDQDQHPVQYFGSKPIVKSQKWTESPWYGVNWRNFFRENRDFRNLGSINTPRTSWVAGASSLAYR